MADSRFFSHPHTDFVHFKSSGGELFGDVTVNGDVDSTGTVTAAGFSGVSATAGLALGNDVVVLIAAGAPEDGTTGDNVAGPGSLYIDITAGELYIQTSAITTPVWVLVGDQTSA